MNVTDPGSWQSSILHFRSKIYCSDHFARRSEHDALLINEKSVLDKIKLCIICINGESQPQQK